MLGENPKSLSTGEFAKHFGIKKDTLFYYDRIHLFKPAGKYENGYRYYTYDQIKPFLTIQSFRKVGISIAELKRYLEEQNTEKFVEMAKQQMLKIDEEINKLLQIRQFFSSIISMEEEIKNIEAGRIYLRQEERKYLILSELSKTENMTDLEWEHQFSKALGLDVPAPIGAILQQERLLKSDYIEVNQLFYYSEKATKNMKEAGLYAVTYHQGSYENIAATYERMRQFIQAENYIIVGDAYEDYFYNPLRSNEQGDYLTKISIQIKGSGQ